jgi:hypothetical protein
MPLNDLFNKKGGGKNSSKAEGDDFENAWFSLSPDPSSSQKKLTPGQQNLADIKKFAYDQFDTLDTNKNGFIEASELQAIMNDSSTPMREKSFIMFLLSNQQEIADSVQEGTPEYRDGISRLDIEQYFKIVISRMG